MNALNVERLRTIAELEFADVVEEAGTNELRLFLVAYSTGESHGDEEDHD